MAGWDIEGLITTSPLAWRRVGSTGCRGNSGGVHRVRSRGLDSPSLPSIAQKRGRMGTSGSETFACVEEATEGSGAWPMPAGCDVTIRARLGSRSSGFAGQRRFVHKMGEVGFGRCRLCETERRSCKLKCREAVDSSMSMERVVGVLKG